MDNELSFEIFRLSNSKYWSEAIREWEITDVYEDTSSKTSCICGHPNIKYVFEITNKFNGKKISPIGSKCIKKIGSDDLYDSAETQMKLFKLLHAFKECKANETVSIKSEYFSRKLLKHLYEIGAFETSDGRYSPEDNYSLLLKVFNTSSPSTRQEKAAAVILLCVVKPFLIKNLVIK